MDHEIKLNRDYYVIHMDVYEWLRENLGSYWDNPDPAYDIHQMFGYTVVKFKLEDDLHRFVGWVTNHLDEYHKSEEFLRIVERRAETEVK